MENNTIFHQYFTQVVFWLITNDIIFTKAFKEFAPQVADKIETFSKNPNCSCRGAIGDYINSSESNYSNTKRFVLDFLQKNPQVKIDLEKIEKDNKTVDARGQVFRIAKNDKAFQDFYRYMIENRFQYRHFSIVPDGESWVIFFL